MTSSPTPDAPHRFRSALSRLRPGAPTVPEPEGVSTGAGACTPCGELQDRQRSVVTGDVRTVRLRPRGGVPALEAEVFDGSGVLGVIWLGRREIAGIEPGRRMRVRGLVAHVHGRPVMFNPRYDLLPDEAA